MYCIFHNAYGMIHIFSRSVSFCAGILGLCNTGARSGLLGHWDNATVRRLPYTLLDICFFEWQRRPACVECYLFIFFYEVYRRSQRLHGIPVL